MKRRIISILLALCLALTLLPAAAFAAEEGVDNAPAAAGASGGEAAGTGATAEEPQQEQQKAQPEEPEQPQQPEQQPEANPEPQLEAEGENTPALLNGEGENTLTNAAEKAVSTAEELTAAIKDYTVTTVKLTANIVFDGTLTVTRAVTLDLNGFTLKFANPRQISITTYGRNTSFTKNYPIGILVEFQGSQSGQLTLTDGSEAATGRLEMTGVNDVAIFVTGGGTLTMTGGTITNSYSGEINGIPDMTGIAILRGTAAMTGGRIENQRQMGVWVCASTFTMGGKAVISGCGTATGMPSFVGGGVLVQYSCAPYEKNDPQRTIISSYFTLEGGAKIENCAARIGGGVCVGDNCLFTMTGGSITGCTALTEGGGVVTEGYGPGSTSEDRKPVFIMSGGSISDCKAGDTYGGTGGGVSVGAMLAGSTTLSAFEMTGGTITGCKAVNGGGVNIQSSGTFTMTNGSITDCEALLGGGVELRQANTGIAPTMFTMSGGSITGCKAADTPDNVAGLGGGVYMGSGCQLAMSGNARITGCEAARSGSGIYGTNDASYPWQVPLFIRSDNAQVDKGVSMDYALQLVSGGDDFQTVRMDGLGTKESPYQIGTADQLKLFRQIVNGAQTNNQNAVLPPQNTAACAKLTANIDLNNEEWKPIGYASGYDEMKAYSGTFDGQGHTISGLYVDVSVSGLFGYTKDATIKNLTVAGLVDGRACDRAGGIVGYAVGGTIENCGNLCAVIAHGSKPGGGIVGFASDLTVTGCYNAGLVRKGDGSNGGGIVGVGTNVKIYDCYNVGEVEGYSRILGGIVGAANGSVSVYNCYNAGSVKALDPKYEKETVRGIVGGGDGPVQIQNCYYLEGTREDAEATAKPARAFADGTVLAALKAGERTGTDPWDSVSKEGNNMILPGFTWQTNDHTHTWGEWTPNDADTDTHIRTCSSCQAVDEDAHDWDSGTVTKPATCLTAGIKRYTCQVCSATKDGRIDATGHSWKTEWASDATHHWHECANDYCDVKDNNTEKAGYAQHTGGTATCTEKAVCKDCGKAYGETNPANHDWNAWKPNGNDTHTRTCKRDTSHTETVNCSGGTATCTAKAKCTTCGGEYGSTAPNNHDGNLKHEPAKAATTFAEGNIEYWYCPDCGKYYKDAKTTQEIGQKDTVTSRLTSGTGGGFPFSGKKDDGKKDDAKTVKSGQTGDPGVALYGAMALLSLAGGTWLVGKKRK